MPEQEVESAPAKRGRGRLPGHPGAGGRKATRADLPDDERPRTMSVYCSPRQKREIIDPALAADNARPNRAGKQ